MSLCIQGVGSMANVTFATRAEDQTASSSIGLMLNINIRNPSISRPSWNSNVNRFLFDNRL